MLVFNVLNILGLYFERQSIEYEFAFEYFSNTRKIFSVKRCLL